MFSRLVIRHSKRQYSIEYEHQRHSDDYIREVGFGGKIGIPRRVLWNLDAEKLGKVLLFLSFAGKNGQIAGQIPSFEEMNV